MARANSQALLDRHPGDRRFKDKFSIHEPLRLAHETARVVTQLTRQNVEHVSGDDLSSKDDVCAAGESKKTGRAAGSGVGDAAEVRGCLDHQDSRKEGPAWNMTCDPEFIVADEPLTVGAGSWGGEPDHSVDHPHDSALGQIAVDLGLVACCDGGVDLVDWEEELGCQMFLEGVRWRNDSNSLDFESIQEVIS